jgi:hypothetical protein
MVSQRLFLNPAVCFCDCSEEGQPVAKKPITFTVTTAAGKTNTFMVTTDSKGIAKLPQTRTFPTEATVTASAVNSKTSLPVESDVPMQIIWYSTAGEQLQLNIGHGTRVLVGTTVPVTATYTGGRNMPFTLCSFGVLCHSCLARKAHLQVSIKSSMCALCVVRVVFHEP